MAYATGTASSWGALRSAISTFCTTTLGTYTEVFSDGRSMDDIETDALCLNHTSTDMNFYYDSGPSNTLAYGTNSHGPSGYYYVVGNMGTGTPDSNERIFEQAGTCAGASLGAQSSAMNHNRGLPKCEFVDFDSGIAYHFFGDTPGTGGQDYFHMVLEIQTSVYSNWWTGQVDSLLSEMVSPYGGFMGCSGPNFLASANRATYRFPMNDNCSVSDGLGLLHFPEGNTASTIDLNGEKSVVWNGQMAATDWCTQATALAGHGSPTSLSYAGKDSVTGRTSLDGVIACVTKDPVNGPQVTGNPSTGLKVVPVGIIPGVSVCTMDGVLAEQEIAVSTETHKVVPLLQRDTTTDSESHPYYSTSSRVQHFSGIPSRDDLVLGELRSGLWGIAYHKTT
jgi:hypothetical protein